jgi:Outer membrane protein beta-barrel domain
MKRSSLSGFSFRKLCCAAWTRPVILECWLALAAALVPSAAAAQQVGVTGGLNAATLVFRPTQDRANGPEHRAGFLLGAFVTCPLHSRADLRVESLVSQKGVNELFRFGDELALTDFEIPVLIQFNLHQSGTPGAHLFVGPTFAFTMAATYHDEGASEDVKSDLDRTTDVGVTIGGGVRFAMVSVDARYTWGLSSLLTDGDTGAALKNQTFSVSAGFALWRRR